MKKLFTKLLSLTIIFTIFLSVVSMVSFAEDEKLDVLFEGRNVSIPTDFIGKDKYDLQEDYTFDLVLEEGYELSFCYATVVGSAFTQYLEIYPVDEDTFVINPQLSLDEIDGAYGIMITAVAQSELVTPENMDKYATYEGESFVPKNDGIAFEYTDNNGLHIHYGVISKHQVEKNTLFNASVFNVDYAIDAVLIMFAYNSKGELVDCFYEDYGTVEKVSYLTKEDCTIYVFMGKFSYYDTDIPLYTSITLTPLNNVNLLPVTFEGKHVSISSDSIGENKYNAYTAYDFTLTAEEDYTVSYVHAYAIVGEEEAIHMLDVESKSPNEYYIRTDYTPEHIDSDGISINIVAVAHKDTIAFENMASYATEGDKTFTIRENGVRFDTEPDLYADYLRCGALTKATVGKDQILKVKAEGAEEGVDTIIFYYVYNEDNEFVEYDYIDRESGETLLYYANEPVTVYIFTTVYHYINDLSPISVTHNVSNLTDEHMVSISFEGINVELTNDITGENLFVIGTKGITGEFTVKEGCELYGIYATVTDEDGANEIYVDYFDNEFYIGALDITGDVVIHALAYSDCTDINDPSATEITKDYTDVFVPAKNEYVLSSEGDLDLTEDDIYNFGKRYKFDIKKDYSYTITLSNDEGSDYILVLYAEDEYGSAVKDHVRQDHDNFESLGEEWSFISDYDCTLYIGAFSHGGIGLFKEATFTFTEGPKSVYDNIIYDIKEDHAEIIGNNFPDGKVVIPDTVNGVPVTVINEEAFSYCDTMTEIVLPKNLGTIGRCAFANCINLTTVTIPTSLGHIDDYAFESCDNLNTVIYEGTLKAWNEIYISEIGNYWLTKGELIFKGDSVLYGDVNSDTFINKKDDLALRKYLADPAYTIDVEAANVFYDSAVNKKDLLRLKQYLADPDVNLGPETTVSPDGSFELPEDSTEN